ncbi:Ig-like domain-containing protein [Leucothrix arctica]|uniref:Amine oxidase n=1 Tax=Leucothrix arctica TaxID=1481894 RepID=A0A317CBP5_9GAMM|nr:Ig-like domain-containing protein [Leucothrix arctica]PWQ95978.1 hypothetical protein DKT75_11410 [Leucothrix arctica]
MNKATSIKRFIQLIIVSASLWGLGSVQAAEHCADSYSIDQTLPNGSRWDMCWTHNNNHGISYHHIYYTPKNGTRRLILNDASIAQIHVPYDDNGARYHDVSDYGLGGGYLQSMTTDECEGGTFGVYSGKNAVCSQVQKKSAAYRYAENVEDADALKVFSVSKVGAYVYIPQWLFYGDGRIEPSLAATGSLQRFTSSTNEDHGWLMSSLANNTYRIGLSHIHNYFWRLDFDVNGTGSDDVVQEINYTSSNGQRQRTMTTFNTEVARDVSPTNMRSWLIRDGALSNTKGHQSGYEIRLPEAGHREIGPSFEPFTNNDFYVTRYNSCEQIASHNQRVNTCDADSLDEFVNGETLTGQDLVTWVGLTFYHMPRSEDAPQMDLHSNRFEIIPRDWHDKNPLTTIVITSPEALVATEDTATTDAGVAITIDVLANDTGTGIYLNEVNNPANGTAVISGGKIVYTPNAGYAGTEVFWYNIKDTSGATYGTKITVTVSGTDYSAFPSGNVDNVTTASNTALTVDVLANDVGNELRISSFNAGTEKGGVVTKVNEKLVYTPSQNYVGTDTFWYNFLDSLDRGYGVLVTVEVTGTDPSVYPTGTADNVTTAINTGLLIDVLSNDIGSGLTLSSTNAWSLNGGQVVIESNQIRYTPKTDFVGEDKLWYVFADSLGRINNGEVTITISGSAAAPYPVAISDTVTTAVNTAVTINVLANDIGSGLSISEVNDYSVNSGTVTIVNGSLLYTPEQGFTGTDSFWYAITDSLNRSNAIQVFVTVGS